MKKLFIFILLLIFPILNYVNAREIPLELTADSYIIIDMTEDEVIYEKNADKVEILASLTKMMTAYTAIDHVENLNKKVTITENDLKNLYGFTQAGLEEGDKVTYMDLLYAMMLPSGADGAQALALHISGSNSKFVKLMNEEAKKLGLTNTHFADSYGGDDNNTSTAREMAEFLKIALQNKTFKKVFSTTERTLSNKLRVVNYTRSLAFFHGLDTELLTGNKSGYTPEAGLLLASTATINDKDYMVILMKAEENEYLTTHVLETYKIYNYISTQTFSEEKILTKGEYLATIPVEDSTISDYIITADEDITSYLNEEEIDDISYEYHLATNLTPQNNIGDNLGYIDIILNDEIIGTYHVYLKDQIFAVQKKAKISIIFIVFLAFATLVLLCTNLLTLKKKKVGVTK